MCLKVALSRAAKVTDMQRIEIVLWAKFAYDKRTQRDTAAVKSTLLTLEAPVFLTETFLGMCILRLVSWANGAGIKLVYDLGPVQDVLQMHIGHQCDLGWLALHCTV
jgi:hypothetical protein